VAAAVRARNVRCHGFYSVRKTSIIPSYFLAPSVRIVLQQDRFISFSKKKKHLLGYYITSIEVAVVHRIRLKTTQHSGNGMCPSPGEDGRDRIFFGGP